MSVALSIVIVAVIAWAAVLVWELVRGDTRIERLMSHPQSPREQSRVHAHTLLPH